MTKSEIAIIKFLSLFMVLIIGAGFERIAENDPAAMLLWDSRHGVCVNLLGWIARLIALGIALMFAYFVIVPMRSSKPKEPNQGSQLDWRADAGQSVPLPPPPPPTRCNGECRCHRTTNSDRRS